MKKDDYQKKFNIQFHRYKIYLWNKDITQKDYLGIITASNKPDARIRAVKKFKINVFPYLEVKAIRKNIKLLSINQELKEVLK